MMLDSSRKAHQATRRPSSLGLCSPATTSVSVPTIFQSNLEMRLRLYRMLAPPTRSTTDGMLQLTVSLSPTANVRVTSSQHRISANLYLPR